MATATDGSRRTAANKRAANAAQSASPSGFAHFATVVAHVSGRPAVFFLCCMVVVVWGISGPFFHYSDTWQLVINTGTTIVTFLMVFLIQNTQNRDGAALQAKLDELIRATEDARDAYMGIENLPEKELDKMREECTEAAETEQDMAVKDPADAGVATPVPRQAAAERPEGGDGKQALNDA